MLPNAMIIFRFTADLVLFISTAEHSFPSRERVVYRPVTYYCCYYYHYCYWAFGCRKQQRFIIITHDDTHYKIMSTE